MPLDAPTRTPPEVRPNALPIRLRVWGVTERDQDHAIDEAGAGWGRKLWQFTTIERLTGATNPLPKYEHSMIAADAGYGWAYIASPDRTADR